MSIAATLQNLYEQYGHLSGISIECQRDLVAIGIRNKSATAEVFLQGAQVTRYQPQGQSPALFLSKQCTYQQDVPLRGGIPICWPWFGQLNKNADSVTRQLPDDIIDVAPAHGFVRAVQWQVDSITTPSDDVTEIELSYGVAQGEGGWPYSTALNYRITIGRTLSVDLTVTNTDNRTFCYTNALHTYLSVNDIRDVFIQGFDQSDYIDALDKWTMKTQQGPITLDEEVDRIYQRSPDHIHINDSQNKLCIRAKGSESTVIWNPWVKKSESLSQFAPEDYTQMVCVETANAVDAYITLEAGESHTLSTAIS